VSLLLLFPGVVLSPSGLVVGVVVVLAGGTGIPTEGSGFGVLDPLSLLSGLFAGLGTGVDTEFVRLRLRRVVVGLGSVDSTTRLRLRRGVGLSSVDSTTRLRLRRGVGLSSVDWTRSRLGVDSGVDST
jgi:hypothetical protein